MLFGQGKWYPGEQLPRWALALIWRRDGTPLWRDPHLIANEETDAGHDAGHALRLMETLAAKLGLDADLIVPAYEDPWPALDAEAPDEGIDRCARPRRARAIAPARLMRHSWHRRGLRCRCADRRARHNAVSWAQTVAESARALYLVAGARHRYRRRSTPCLMTRTWSERPCASKRGMDSSASFCRRSMRWRIIFHWSPRSRK